jgi:hypothetical protein
MLCDKGFHRTLGVRVLSDFSQLSAYPPAAPTVDKLVLTLPLAK